MVESNVAGIAFQQFSSKILITADGYIKVRIQKEARS
jgi:hypothetical protein